MGKIFFLTLAWVFVAHAAQGDERVREIDHQIEQLEEIKRGYEARALRHENQAERLQFDTQAVLETRRHNRLAEENRKKAALVQKKIDALKEERAWIVKGKT